MLCVKNFNVYIDYMYKNIINNYYYFTYIILYNYDINKHN